MVQAFRLPVRYKNKADEVAKIFGDGLDEMWYVDGLCTAPHSQGRGYSGTLLDEVTAMVRPLSYRKLATRFSLSMTQ